MIIRILTEGQYRLKNEALSELDKLDDELLEAIANNDEEGFNRRFCEVLTLIRDRGTKVEDTELVESDLVLPAPDTTLEEARELFAAYPRKLGDF
ncbi:MAG: hypothetical protein IMW96_03135 [Thermoanaerobacteraceae bacterium]|uniref:PspA-associated protein PspAA n=1 Tax=Thermanaeromonas sp. C210 TaxID=2731925 RepID=UPI00155CE16F|nr:hypothetical protein [Thermanaeromonas sp. C210]MBE3580625.1 hypothetical protein [Thermoanaerobacteraceae bacterium]GFN24209.1 hypothetical protein TAMC210_25270 [Thermanaeromonas sp. C210]